MRYTKIAITLLRCTLLTVTLAAFGVKAQTLTKGVVGEKIRRVEDGVDEFQKYLERRGDSARSTAASPQAQANKGKRRTTTSSQPSTANANAKKDELEDAMGDLNRSTNRLRRKFDPADKWIETKPQVELFFRGVVTF